jgi:dipeptidyl aminopeptidase/acylaminoacyl peptidase
MAKRARRGGASQSIALACALLTGCGGTGASPVSGSTLGVSARDPAAVTRVPPDLVFTGPDIPGSSGPQELFTSELGGRGRLQLTHDGFPRFLPHFSPDGRRLVYGKFLSGGYGDPSAISVIVVYDLASGRETRLTSGGEETQAVWSPDGKRIAYGTISGNALWMMNADGSHRTVVRRPSGAPDDQRWDDFLWSRDNWIYFTVGQTVRGCFKVRIDRIRPSGTDRTRITDGGPSCTPPGFEQSGDADPGITPDGKTIYSSRGLPRAVPGMPTVTVRHLYRFSSEPYAPGKVETDLSRGAERDCVAGVPKVSPNGRVVSLFLLCPNDLQHRGITLTDPDGTSFRFVETGFAADWNPTLP